MLRREHSLLIVIDVQGKLAELVQDSERVQDNIEILIQGMKILDIPVLATEQYPKGLGPTAERIARHFDDIPVLEKSAFSCCAELPFEIKLTELHKTDLIVCGIESHVCVYQTVRDLVGLGYDVHLVIDAVSSRTESNRSLGIQNMKSLGARLTSTEMLLFELLEVSGTEQFKAISKLVK